MLYCIYFLRTHCEHRSHFSALCVHICSLVLFFSFTYFLCRFFVFLCVLRSFVIRIYFVVLYIFVVVAVVSFQTCCFFVSSLQNGSVVMFGRVASYRFVDSPTDGRYNLALSQSQLDSACLYERFVLNFTVSPRFPFSRSVSGPGS